MIKPRRSTQGQILILIVIVLIGLILIFAISSIISPRVRAAPTVQSAFWQVGDQQVTTATTGQQVTALVTVQATEEYVGSIVLKIRKDIRFWPDSDYHVQTIPVNLKGGQTQELEATFTPDQASGGSLRGYFIEIDFQVTRTSWVMENAYPPRLTVTG